MKIKDLKQNQSEREGHEIYDGGWIHKFQFERCYIQEALTELQVVKWRQDTPILISSQTGTGKSTFILKTLCPILRARGRPVLILCSRIALKKQYKLNAIDLFLPERKGDWTDSGLEKEHTFGNVDIYSYQESQILLETQRIKEYGAVIFDECHFFINDASFNRYTQEIFRKILDTQKKAIRIYMTATPDGVFDEILRREKEIKYPVREIMCLQDRYHHYAPLFHENGEDRPHAKIYHFRRDYTYLSALFFKDLDWLVQIIRQDSSNQKWLVFVSRKEEGKIIEKQLGAAYAEYLDAELKDGEKQAEFQKILLEKSYNKKVLIVTKFLDVGVDLCDETIKNIVIFPTTKTDFFQMVGRKRIRKGECINLYIHIRDIKEYRKTLSGLKNKYRDMVQAINTINKFCTGSELEFPLFLYKNDKELEIRYNAFSIVNIKQHMKELQDLIQECSQRLPSQSVDESIARFYLDWIGQKESYYKHMWLEREHQEDIVNKIEVLLRPVLGREITGNEFLDIRCKLLELWEEHTGEKQRKDRREKGLGCANIKKFFREVQAPFRLISKSNGVYCFERGCNS